MTYFDAIKQMSLEDMARLLAEIDKGAFFGQWYDTEDVKKFLMREVEEG